MIEDRIDKLSNSTKIRCIARPHCQRICANYLKKKSLFREQQLDLLQSRTAFFGRFTLSSMFFDRVEFPLLHKLGLYAKDTAGNGLVPLPPIAIVDIDCYQQAIVYFMHCPISFMDTSISTRSFALG